MNATGGIVRASRMLPDDVAAQAAFMSWLETVISRSDRVYRIVAGLEHDEDRRFSNTIWADHDLVGIALGTEVFRGGEWMLTTYTVDGVGAL